MSDIDYFGLIDESILLLEQHYKELLNEKALQDFDLFNPITEGGYDNSYDESYD